MIALHVLEVSRGPWFPSAIFLLDKMQEVVDCKRIREYGGCPAFSGVRKGSFASLRMIL